jgi:hypothetical protein
MTLHRAALALAALSVVACSKPTAPAQVSAAPAAKAAPAQAAAAPAPTPAAAGEGLQLSAFERSLIEPLLEDVRKGVRPIDEQGLGVCSTTGKDCVEFLGAAPGELPAGKYLVKAELAVPRLGDKGTWTVAFEVKCTTTTTTGSTTNTSTNTFNRTFEVNHSTQERGYRLMPLASIESPNKGGARSCAYSITTSHPDGGKVYSGGWSVPQG